MIRQELEKKLATNIFVSKQKAKEILYALLEGIILGVHQDGKTSIRKFGLFTVKHKKETNHYCHFSGKKLKIPASKTAIFHASKELKKIINTH